MCIKFEISFDISNFFYPKYKYIPKEKATLSSRFECFHNGIILIVN